MLLFNNRAVVPTFVHRLTSIQGCFSSKEQLLERKQIQERDYFGEGDGTPLQCSCLDNPMDAGAWWAAVHGVA